MLYLLCMRVWLYHRFYRCHLLKRLLLRFCAVPQFPVSPAVNVSFVLIADCTGICVNADAGVAVSFQCYGHFHIADGIGSEFDGICSGVALVDR